MEDTQAPVSTGTEQPAQTSTAVEQPATDSSTGQGQAGVQQSEQPAGTPAHSGTEEDSFFDPKQVPPELMPAYKQMQKSFTKRMQGISTEKQKIEAYNAFTQDPVGTLRQVAKQYGLDIAPAGQPQPNARTQPEGAWEPQSWDEVLERAQELAEQRVLAKLGPVIQQVQETRASNIEKQLDEVDPQWREYEDEMRQSLREHPTLAKNAALLYRLSVPSEVQEQKAVQEALRKLERKTQSAQVGAGASQQVKSTPAPGKVDSFSDAVEQARKQLAKQGR